MASLFCQQLFSVTTSPTLALLGRCQALEALQVGACDNLCYPDWRLQCAPAAEPIMKILHLYFSVVLIFSYLVMLWTGMLSKSYSRVAAWRGSTPLDRGIPAARRDPRAPAGSANTEVATRGVGLTTPAGEGLAVTAVARWAWEKFPGHLWRGLQLPVMTAWPAGRLGNLMSEYATLYALGKVYGVTVRLHPLMDAALRHIFPHLSMPLIPGNFSDKEWKQLGSLGLSNKADMDAAAAGLMGPHLFVLRGTPHESQLFNAYRRDIQRELTFSDTITTKAQAFLAAVARNTTFPSTPTFVGFHIRRTDYYFMIKVIQRRRTWASWRRVTTAS
ncbi:uncharacterized protein [Procambarus clarkii]|uniref:uncharacterized protein isoform X2 n=1 Tax=Procambarus clarkii TaxID=6728 RepID=UPI003743FE1C